MNKAPRALAYEPRYALNAICPYFTMFPLEYPLRVLRKHRVDSPIVMDPFCGRGTTLFAARALGLVSRGLDTSPVAVAIAKAKLSNVEAEAALELAQSYIDDNDSVVLPQTEFFERAFHPKVLKAICAIRQGLLTAKRQSDEVILLRATMLGCLHGPTGKRLENQSYFSNQMPRTFASKPDYSVRYWKANGLKAPKTNVIDVLRRKLCRIDMTPGPDESSPSNVRLGDSRRAASLPISNRDFSVVVTSPPYYGMKTYVQDQWLRNWFLGGPESIEYANGVQLEHTGEDVFAKSLGLVWRNMARTQADSLDMYIRFGIIPSSKVDAKALMLSSLEESGVAWKVVHTTEAETASSGKRQADHMAAGSTAAVEYDFHVRRK